MSQNGSNLHVVTLCTGNAARSVMAGIMLSQLAENEGLSLRVTTAGTHVLEGQPMGMRTKEAILAIGELDATELGRHRSHQLTDEDCATADLVVCMEADHVRYVRRIHPEAAGHTATIHRVTSEVAASDEPFPHRLRALDLATVDLASEIDVLDPAGGDQATYDACAREIWELSQALITLLG